jgi:predicted proteasome-type protease
MSDVEINLADLKAVVDIINLMASRGAIRGQELSVIGGVYNKYSHVIEKIKEKQDSSRPGVESDSTN